MKYTFEIMKEYEDAFRGISVYSVSEDKKLMVDFVAIEELEDAQKEIDEAYHKGLADGKEQNEKGCEGCKYETVEDGSYPCSECAKVCLNYYMPKQKDDEIKVGDEMRQVYESGAETGVRCIVTAIDGDCMSGFSQYGRATVCSSQVNRWWKKTGRHFAIDKILEEMRHD